MKKYSHKENVAMTIKRLWLEVDYNDVDFRPSEIRKAAQKFVAWEERNMPKDKYGIPDWESVAENRLTIKSFYNDEWHAVCDWAESLNHFIYGRKLPRVCK